MDKPPQHRHCTCLRHRAIEQCCCFAWGLECASLSTLAAALAAKSSEQPSNQQKTYRRFAGSREAKKKQNARKTQAEGRQDATWISAKPLGLASVAATGPHTAAQSAERSLDGFVRFVVKSQNSMVDHHVSHSMAT